MGRLMGNVRIALLQLNDIINDCLILMVLPFILHSRRDSICFGITLLAITRSKTASGGRLDNGRVWTTLTLHSYLEMTKSTPELCAKNILCVTRISAIWYINKRGSIYVLVRARGRTSSIIAPSDNLHDSAITTALQLMPSETISDVRTVERDICDDYAESAKLENVVSFGSLSLSLLISSS